MQEFHKLFLLVNQLLLIEHLLLCFDDLSFEVLKVWTVVDEFFRINVRVVFK